MSGFPMYPERDCFFAPSFIAAAGVTGTAIDLANFMENVGSIIVAAPPTLAAAVTVTLQAADGDPAQNYCTPLNAWANMDGTGICDPAVTPLQIVMDPASPLFSNVYGMVCRIPIQCRKKFLRASLSAASAGLMVWAVGKARRLDSV
jgi:hypothetical protein